MFGSLVEAQVASLVEAEVVIEDVSPQPAGSSVKCASSQQTALAEGLVKILCLTQAVARKSAEYLEQGCASLRDLSS